MSHKSILSATFFTLALGASATSLPVSAQNYGNGYGYNNGIKNGYGPSYTRPSGGSSFPSNYQPGLDRNIRYAPGSCAAYVHC